MGVIMQAEEDCVVDSVMGYTDIITGTPGTIRVGIQSVTAAGIPSGTWIAFGDFTANATNFPQFTTFKKTLTTTGSVTRGQQVAVVFAPLSGTFNGTNFIRFYYANGTALGEYTKVYPYTYGASGGGAAAKSTTAFAATAGYGSSTRHYGFACGTSGVASWNSTGTPDERGMKFSIPTGTCTSYKVAGIRLLAGITNSAATWDLVLYDSANTVLQSISFTNSAMFNTASIGLRDFYFDESTLSALTPGLDYRIVVKPTAASLGAMVYNIAGSAWPLAPAINPGGTWAYTTRTDAGAWTDDPNVTMPLKLILHDVTSNGGGGAIIPVGMTGGIRG
jgi:hypothetical protein